MDEFHTTQSRIQHAKDANERLKQLHISSQLDYVKPSNYEGSSSYNHSMNVSQILNSSGNQRSGAHLSHNLGVISEYKITSCLDNPGFLEK